MKGLFGLGAGLFGATVSAFDLKSNDELKAIAKPSEIRIKTGEPRMATKNLEQAEDILHTISGIEDDLFLEFYSGYYFNSSESEIEDAMNQCWDLMAQDSFARANDFYSILGLPDTDLGSRTGWEMPIVRLLTQMKDGEKLYILSFSQEPKVTHEDYHMYDCITCVDESMFYLDDVGGEELNIFDPITGTFFNCSREKLVKAMGKIHDIMVVDGFATFLDFFEIAETKCENEELADILGWEMPRIEFDRCPNGAMGVYLPHTQVLFRDFHGWEF